MLHASYELVLTSAQNGFCEVMATYLGVRVHPCPREQDTYRKSHGSNPVRCSKRDALAWTSLAIYPIIHSKKQHTMTQTDSTDHECSLSDWQAILGSVSSHGGRNGSQYLSPSLAFYGPHILIIEIHHVNTSYTTILYQATPLVLPLLVLLGDSRSPPPSPLDVASALEFTVALAVRFVAAVVAGETSALWFLSNPPRQATTGAADARKRSRSLRAPADTNRSQAACAPYPRSPRHSYHSMSGNLWTAM
ncbi:hypothetical protein B0H21DRAFT_525878 [Amylocystis lapponica]|nr:hypothetical protein B0H21DRAFT_525878 [Amylocystis lapponica]